MPIQRRNLLGGVLLGLGAGAENYTARDIKRRSVQDQQQFELQKLQLGEVEKLQNNLATHPEQVPFFLEAAKANPLLAGLDLSPLKGAARTMGTQSLTSSLNTAASPEAMPADLGTALASRSGQPAPSLPTSSLLGQFGQEAQQEDPTMNTLAQTAGARLGQLGKAEDDKTTLLNTRKQGEAYATGVGTNAAKNENFPIELQNKLAELQQTGPVEATNAGLTTGAQKRAGLAPDIVQGEADAAATKTGAEKRAGLAPDIVTAETRAAGAKAGAERGAVLSQDYNPVNIANAAKLAGEKAKAEAVAKGDTGKLKYIETAKENGVILGAQLQRLMNLYDQARKGDVKAMSLYSDLSNNLRPTIARASGYNGRMTNAELGIAGSAIPGVKDALLGTADQKFKYIKGLATYGPTVAAQLPADASIDEYMSTVQRLVDQEPPPSGKQPSPGATLNRLMGTP